MSSKSLQFTPTAHASDHDVTLIIPAHNEEQRLGQALDDAAAFLDDWGIDYRVLVADDGSSDDTPYFTDDYGPRFTTLRLDSRGGKGRAVRAAMLEATGRVLAFTDADLPFDLEALRAGFERIAAGACDVVFGARDLAGADRRASRDRIRDLATVVFRSAMRAMIGGDVTDTQCGLKLFSRRAALEIFSRGTIDGFAFDAEVVLLTYQMGLTFERTPVTLINDYGSSVSLWRSAIPMLWDVFQLTRRRHDAGWFTPRFGHVDAAEPVSEDRDAA